jgi:hypothetical protein
MFVLTYEVDYQVTTTYVKAEKPRLIINKELQKDLYVYDRLHTKFQIPGPSGTLVNAIKPKTKYRLHAAAILFTVSKIILTKFAYFLKSC